MSAIARGARPPAAILLGALMFALAASAGLYAQAAPPAAGPDALLIRGAEPTLGLPGFGANAIPALYGEYRLAAAISNAVVSDAVAAVAAVAADAADAAVAAARNAATVRVWVTRAALYFAPSRWTTERFGAFRVYRQAVADDPELPAGAAWRLIAFDRPLPPGGQGGLPEEWSLVIAVPAEGTPPAVERAFLERFIDRFGYFAASAKTPPELSLPAYLKY